MVQHFSLIMKVLGPVLKILNSKTKTTIVQNQQNLLSKLLLSLDSIMSNSLLYIILNSEISNVIVITYFVSRIGEFVVEQLQ